MNQPKIGLITFGDERTHEWNNVFKRMTEPRHAQAIVYFQGLPVTVQASADVARTKHDIDGQVDALVAAGVEVLVAHVPCWTAPNLVVRGIQRAGLPTVLLSNKGLGTHGTVGLLGAGGALNQIGYDHLRVREDFEGNELAAKALPFIRAASAVRRLRGSVFGLFGGRSLGIDTGSFDPMQWRDLFGVDVEHIDQSEIIRLAEAMPEDAAQPMIDWMAGSVRAIAFNDTTLTPAKLSLQVRCYLATRQIVEDKGIDFAAIKCMPEMTNFHVAQCLSAAFMPGPYDASGPKEPVAFSCEADGDGALTMEILKQVSGGKPTLFADLSYVNEQTSTLYLPNCGALCSWYAARSDVPEENLGRIELRPANRPAGGANTSFRAGPGPLTLARLYRKKGQYYMAIIQGDVVEPDQTEIDAFVAARGKHQLPTAFVKVSLDYEKLIAEFGANHISGVAGSYVNELMHTCHLLNIEPVFFN